MSSILHHRLPQNAPAQADAALPPLTFAVRVAGHLSAAIGGREPAENVVLALRTLLLGLADPHFRADAAALVHIENLLRAAAPIVAESVSQALPPEDVHLGCAAAAGLLHNIRTPAAHREPPALLLARLQHTALLADQLDAMVRRRNIEAGGDLFRRAIELLRMRDAAPADGMLS